AFTKKEVLKIIMVSVDDTSDTIQTALSMGSDAYIIKPINRNKLASAFKAINYI
ncbi:MAG: hypothetical protein GY729_10860, partial [Desulfobacteraceae bacterium]|nr:hypothetical protein [Desulfobacteraceae bacterium]